MNRLKTLFVIFMLLASTSVFSKENTITLGSAYANEVWFSFTDGIVKTESATNWDIGFQTFSQNAGIIINSGKGVTLWVVKGSDGDSWDAKIDTTGMSSSWVKGNNSIDSWSVGAFNLGLNGFEADGDFGWGSYDMSTHAIAGSKVFVVKLSSTSYKKVMIESLVGGIYTILVANLDGSGEAKYTVAKSKYSNKLYTYMELATGTIIEREPEYDKWDLVFGKYTDLIDMGNGTFTPYNVTGVRTHPALRTAIVKGVPTGISNAPAISDETYFTKITTIGSNWKKLNGQTFTYTIVDSVTYFATRAQNGDSDPIINKIVFKSFEGSSTGKLSFDLNGGTTSVDENTFNNLNIFPSIVDRSAKVNVDLGDFRNQTLRTIKIYNTIGNLVNSIEGSNNSPATFEISLENLSAGEYFMIFEFENTNLLKKVIVK